MARTTLLKFAASPRLQSLARNYGLALGGRRFVAGETIHEALEQARKLNQLGFKLTLDILGESVNEVHAVEQAAAGYVKLLRAIDTHGIDANISVKPTQLGLAIDFDLAVQALTGIIDEAYSTGNFVRLDMEDSSHVEATLKLYRSLRERRNNVGVAIQAYLYRSWNDLRQLAQMGTNVRLVKGAYDEPPAVAYQKKRDVDENYRRLIAFYLDSGNYTAVATHDDKIIDFTLAYVARRQIPREQYEFQFLYGVRPGLQQQLLARGERVRIYLPYGPDWFPYFMRRLAERPANLVFVLKNLLRP